ncbi:BLOC-2 complex member HPS5 isoform X4 [Monodelphis domestica]|uniref:BLOC-2 complex member HPS5 isoform X4 n=1 Tax=Monodelphis domestica TaxID=13616 RepID=UPI000443122C|nr:BLOC-2 complex member HPS5 isoform X4 [Monodelphis domestica]
MNLVPGISESSSHVLAEFESLDPLLSALRLDSSRLKCTSIAVSRKWLALGSSGGGLNLIQKEIWEQRLFLSHREGAVSQVACCLHDDDYIAVATSQGFVVVWELNQERRGKPERIYVSSEHKGRRVTALCWDTTILRVFVGDHLGRISAIKLNTSKQGKAAATFMMFPVQTITTVDSRIVQLDYLDGRLLVSSLTRSFLCDTEREKFWKIGTKERDGEYGACFFPGRSSGTQQPLIYCARPGSRMWEVNFEGEVLSTHQFKKLLSSSPLPVINLRSEPQFKTTVGSLQSLTFSKLLYLSEHYVLTWNERGIYIFIPQNVQVLLWSEVKDIQDVAVYRNELFCLHMNGKVSHLFLLSVERCVDRLLRRGLWALATHTCCLFQNSIILSRARKTLPIDKLEHLKSQLDITTQSNLIAQLEELISKLEPLDSACSSRRSSISSHESFSILDSGIYRVISRRGSQSDEDSSLHSQTLSEDERLKELIVHHEEDRPDQDTVSHASVTDESDRNEAFLPFGIPLSFRSSSPLASLQAVKESVSSFVRKTTEKIGTLHSSSDLKTRPEATGDEQPHEEDANIMSCPQEDQHETDVKSQSSEEDKLQELKVATTETVFKLQDPLVLFQPTSLRLVLQEWLLHLEETFAMKDLLNISENASLHTKTDQDMPGLLEMAFSSPVSSEMEVGDMPTVLKFLDDLASSDNPLFMVHVIRLYEKFGEKALRCLVKFFPSIMPSDIMQLCRNHPAHFLVYLDSLVKSKPEDHRLSFLESLLQPESLKLDWLLLAVTHDAPERTCTVDDNGHPRSHSHLFTWGYSHLIMLLIKLPANFIIKEKMMDICKSHGFWPGYLILCLELDRRKEAFTNMVYLNDMRIVGAENGWIPETVDEWKLLLNLASSKEAAPWETPDRSVSADSSSSPPLITVENVALLLAKVMGPDRASVLLQECGLILGLSERFTRTCNILRIAEKRQRALIQSMLEKCDRFLWSQQA